jgi:asparagine synthase (glutamine-hydrolysing)
MCGIYGVVSKRYQLLPEVIDSLNQSFMKNMGHRGPDGFGHYLSKDRQLLLGHLRLSIIDIENGHQPMLDRQGNVVIFNGEIYNFNELKSISEDVFMTGSDTEVILSEYRKNGKSFCNSLNGMYSIAFHDPKDNTLSLAVDPIGIKSLYYYEDDNYFVFSSELVPLCKVISEIFEIKLVSNEHATAEYFYHGMYLNENTPIRGVRKFLPGNLHTIKLDSFDTVVSEICFRGSNREKHDLEKIISESVKRQLVSDVPICLFLSGGIDSSLLATVLAKANHKIKCFTFSFDDESIDESSYAQFLASKLNLEHQIVKVEASELIECFVDAISKMDEPISDFASVPLVKLSKEASLNYKVCLLGDGGDELFYGYTHHKFWSLKVFFSKPVFLKINLQGFLNCFSFKFENSKIQFLKKLALLAKLSTPFSASYGPFSNCDYLMKTKFFKPSPLTSVASLLKWERINSLNRKLLQKTDRITMREGLEARVPLLDLELVHNASFYNYDECVKNGRGKVPLRELLMKNLPVEISNRKKQGFRTPASTWLRGPLGHHIHEVILNCDAVDNFFSKDTIELIFSEHRKRVKDNSSKILSIYAFATFWNKLH